MLNNKLSRRSVVKSGAATAVVVGVAASLPVSATNLSATSVSSQAVPAMSNTEQYIYNVLASNFKNSTVVGPLEFKRFAQEFVLSHQGKLDLKQDFSGIAGEYKLVKEFIKTV